MPEPENDGAWAHVAARKRRLEEEAQSRPAEPKKPRLPDDYRQQPRKALGVHRGASKHVDDFQGAVESAFSITGIRKDDADDAADDDDGAQQKA